MKACRLIVSTMKEWEKGLRIFMFASVKPRLKSTEAKRRQVQGLYNRQRGLCYWCKQLMVLFDPTKIRRQRPLPFNLATIDHLDDRFSSERGKHGGEPRRVLACKKCNEVRGRMSELMQPKEVLHARAGRRKQQDSETEGQS